jgi:hypothetical protein
MQHSLHTVPGSFHPLRRSKRPLVSMRRATGRVIEALEDRTLFAWNLAIGLTPTQGVATSTAGNTVTYAAVGAGATLNWSDVTGSLAAGHSVVISSGTTGTQQGNITDNTGVQSGPIPQNLNLRFESGSGTGLIGNISLDNVSLNGSNASITIDANGSVSMGLLSSGTSLNPAPLATVLITANNGSITPRTSPGLESINATTLALKAATGIGTSSVPLKTEVANLSGRAQAGAIFVSNIGDVNISSSSIPDADGLVDYGAGQIGLVNQGSISVTNEAVNTAGQAALMPSVPIPTSSSTTADTFSRTAE